MSFVIIWPPRISSEIHLDVYMLIVLTLTRVYITQTIFTKALGIFICRKVKMNPFRSWGTSCSLMVLKLSSRLVQWQVYLVVDDSSPEYINFPPPTYLTIKNKQKNPSKNPVQSSSSLLSLFEWQPYNTSYLLPFCSETIPSVHRAQP